MIVCEEVLRKKGFAIRHMKFRCLPEKESPRDSWVVREKSYMLIPSKVMLSGQSYSRNGIRR